MVSNKKALKIDELSIRANNQHQQTGISIGDEGASALSEALKNNAALTTLDLTSVQKSEKDGWIANIANNKHKQTGSNIGPEGARALSEALKTNTTLQSLELGCEQ